MTLLDSLLDAIIRLDGEALVMHVGEKPYVVLSSASVSALRGPLAWGQVELSSRPLTGAAMLGMLGQMLSEDQRRALDELGAIEEEIDVPGDSGGRFIVTAARGGDDVWVEVRRHKETVEVVAEPVAVAQDAPDMTSEVAVPPQPAEAVPVEISPAPETQAVTEEWAPVAELEITEIKTEAAPDVDAGAAIADAGAAIAAKVAALAAEAAASFAAREAALASEAEATLAAKVAALTSEAEASLAVKEAALAAQAEASLATKEAALAAQAEASLAAKEAAQAAQAEASLAAKEAALAAQAEAALAAKEAALAAQAEASLAAKEAGLRAEAEAALAARGAAIAERTDTTLAAREATLAAEAERALAAREAALVTESQTALAARAATLAAQAERALAAKEAALVAESRTALAAQQAMLTAQAERALAAKEAALVAESQTAFATREATLTAEAQRALAAREAALVTESQSALAAREAALAAEAERAFAAREAALAAEAERAFAAREAALVTESQTALAAREATLTAQAHRALAAKEAALAADADRALAAREAALAAEAETALAARQAAMLAEAEAALAAKEAALAAENEAVLAAEAEAAMAAAEQAALAAQAEAELIAEAQAAQTAEAASALAAEVDAAAAAETVVRPIARPSLKLQAPQPPAPAAASTEASLVELLRAAAGHRASTVYALVDARPMMRVEGQIALVGIQAAIVSGDVERFIYEFAPRDLVANAAPEWTCEVPGVGRVRCVTFHDQSGAGLIFHLPSPDVSTADEIGLGLELQALCGEADGLIVVAGPRSSGKSGLLSAFVDVINSTRYDHVITIESQIRRVHEKRLSFISQREVRGDGDAIATAARAALREGPDVLVIEDLRAPEALVAALDAARAGRLVFGSISAPTAPGAIERLIDAFPADRRSQVRASLAGALRAVVAQILVPKIAGGRIAAREILLSSPAVRKLVLDGAMAQLPIAIESGRSLGMKTMVDSLGALVRDGVVDIRTACGCAPDRAALVSALERDGIDVSGVERRA